MCAGRGQTACLSAPARGCPAQGALRSSQLLNCRDFICFQQADGRWRLCAPKRSTRSCCSSVTPPLRWSRGGGSRGRAGLKPPGHCLPGKARRGLARNLSAGAGGLWAGEEEGAAGRCGWPIAVDRAKLRRWQGGWGVSQPGLGDWLWIQRKRVASRRQGNEGFGVRRSQSV